MFLVNSVWSGLPFDRNESSVREEQEEGEKARAKVLVDLFEPRST